MRGRKMSAIATMAVFALVGCNGEAGETADTPERTPPAAATGDTAGQQGQQLANLPEGVTQEMVQQGRTLFTGQGTCHACHGPNATGTQLAPDLTDDEWINISSPTIDELTNVIKTGVPQPKEHPGPMPPMGGANLTDEQVRALAAYVLTLGQA